MSEVTFKILGSPEKLKDIDCIKIRCQVCGNTMPLKIDSTERYRLYQDKMPNMWKYNAIKDRFYNIFKGVMYGLKN